MKCPVKFCYNSTGKQPDLKWYSFPEQSTNYPEIRQRWVETCGDISKTARVCSAHFKDEDFEIHTKVYRKLKRNAVPKGRNFAI